MSTEQSKTPITDRAEHRWTNGELECGGSVYADDMRSLELAANALAEKIRKSPHSDTCMSVLWNRRCDCWKSDALAEFEKLKI